MSSIQRNIAKSFRMAREDIDTIRSQVRELSEKQEELQDLVNDLKKKTNK